MGKNDCIFEIETGDLAAVEKALAEGTSPDCLSVIGVTALITAVKKKSLDMVNLLIAKGADVNKADERVTSEKGATPLTTAVQSGEVAIVETLLKAGANPDILGSYYQSPLGIACEYGYEAIVTILLQHDAQVDGTCGFDALTPLMLAAKNRHLEVIDILLSSGAGITAVNKQGNTPLHYGAGMASGLGGNHAPDREVIERLVGSGADVTARDKSGETPLFDCARWLDRAACDVLLSSGAEVNVTNNSGKTPLSEACTWNSHSGVVALLVDSGAVFEAEQDNCQTVLHLACSKESVPPDAVEALCKGGADVKALDDYGNTPLHKVFWGLSEMESQSEKAFILLTYGADVNFPTESKNPIIHGASRSGTLDVCRAVLEAGAVIDAVDEWAHTALHWAAYDGRKEVAEMLIGYGADVNALEGKGNTPLHLSCRQNHLEVSKILLKNGARRDVRNAAGRIPFFYCSDEYIDILQGFSLANKGFKGGNGGSEDALFSCDVSDLHEGRDNLKCRYRRGAADDGEGCSECRYSVHCIGEDRSINCPWCGMKALVISDYQVLHGNPQCPTADTEVEFTYACRHCGLLFRNGWNALNTKCPSVFEVGARTSWASDDGGVTWRRSWSQDE